MDENPYHSLHQHTHHHHHAPQKTVFFADKWNLYLLHKKALEESKGKWVLASYHYKSLRIEK